MASAPLSQQTVLTPKGNMLVGVADTTQPAGLKNGVVTLDDLASFISGDGGALILTNPAVISALSIPANSNVALVGPVQVAPGVTLSVPISSKGKVL